MTKMKWYKLDNAAKIFPSVSNRGRTNVFRLSFEMYEEVDPLILQRALENVIQRFPVMNVKLKKGVFWYYFEANKAIPKIQQENPFITKMMESYDGNDGFLFRVYYYHKRIALEVFHSLTDGAGALEFLKSIVHKYLQLKDIEIKENGYVLTESVEMIREEDQDSFNFHYDPKLKVPTSEPKSLHFKSQTYKNHWLGLIVGTADVTQIKSLSKKYNCTITELLGAVIFQSAYRSQHLFENKDRLFKVFVPVNLRRFFSSKTLRNFSLYARTAVDLNKEHSFEDFVEIIKRDMKDELIKDKLHARFVANVRTEKHLWLRVIPRFLKEIILRIGYYLIAGAVNSMSFSNIGYFELPEEMKKHIEKVVFANGASYTAPINLGVVTFNDKITMAFTSALVDRSFQKEFFRFLSEEGIDIVLEANDLEVD